MPCEKIAEELERHALLDVTAADLAQLDLDGDGSLSLQELYLGVHRVDDVEPAAEGTRASAGRVAAAARRGSVRGASSSTLELV